MPWLHGGMVSGYALIMAPFHRCSMGSLQCSRRLHSGLPNPVISCDLSISHDPWPHRLGQCAGLTGAACFQLAPRCDSLTLTTHAWVADCIAAHRLLYFLDRLLMPGCPHRIVGGRSILSGSQRVGWLVHPGTKFCPCTIVCWLGTSWVPTRCQLVPAGANRKQLVPSW